jgi:hypothetical protein
MHAATAYASWAASCAFREIADVLVSRCLLFHFLGNLGHPALNSNRDPCSRICPDTCSSVCTIFPIMVQLLRLYVDPADIAQTAGAWHGYRAASVLRPPDRGSNAGVGAEMSEFSANANSCHRDVLSNCDRQA